MHMECNYQNELEQSKYFFTFMGELPTGFGEVSIVSNGFFCSWSSSSAVLTFPLIGIALVLIVNNDLNCHLMTISLNQYSYYFIYLM